MTTEYVGNEPEGQLPTRIGLITLDMKHTGKPSAGNLHAGFDAAGTGNQLTVWLVRHSQRKRRATDRPHLRSMAPVLDPTFIAQPREAEPGKLPEPVFKERYRQRAGWSGRVLEGRASSLSIAKSNGLGSEEGVHACSQGSGDQSLS
jgi:hypothetical protein